MKKFNNLILNFYNMKILNHTDWRNAKDFSWSNLVKGKTLPVRVTEEIYWEFLEVLPPIEFGKTRATFINSPIPIQEYFLVGEASAHVKGVPVYACFAKAYDTKYFFMGYLTKK